MNRVPLIALVAAASAARLPAQQAPTARLSGEIRLRGESDGREANGPWDAAVLSRVRLGVTASARPWVRAFAQLQDARAWGTETNTLTDGSADQLDLHEGWIELGEEDGAWRVRLGRQEVTLGDERLVGPVGWTNTGRSLDGAVVTHRAGESEVRVFGFTITERDALLSTGTDPQQNAGGQLDGLLTGGYAALALGGTALELTALYDRDAITDESYTTGARLVSPDGAWLWEAAAAYQFGTRRSALFLSGRLGRPLGALTTTLGADYLSGDDDPLDGDRRAFNTLYHTGHKFYGWMDYYLTFPGATLDAGLVDLMARGALTAGAWRLRGDLHYFALDTERAGESALGWELDLDAGRQLAPGVRLEGGASVYTAGDAAPIVVPAFASGTATTLWAWAQLTVSF